MEIYWCRGPDVTARSEENLKKALTDYFRRIRGGDEPRDIVIGRSPAGKPFLLEQKDVEFSVTHTEDWWICAIQDAANGAVGIDAEKRTRRVKRPQALGKRFFSAKEAEILNGLREKEAEKAFLQIWVRKEAFLKYTGKGLAGGMASFSVVSDEGRGEICFRKSMAAEGGDVQFPEAELSAELYVLLCCRAGMGDKERRIWELT